MFFAKIRSEVFGFSPWCKALFLCAGVLYVALWVLTIQISAIQEAHDTTPVLPVVAEDSAEYADLVQSLLAGEGFAMHGQLETLRTPGYPIFATAIKKIGGSYFAVTFAQILVVFLAAMVVRRIGMRFASRNVGEIAAALLLLNPVTITLALLIYSDILFLLLFTAGFYFSLSLTNEQWFARTLLVSFLFALAIYVRPIGVLALPLFIAPVIVSGLTRRSTLKAIILLLVSIAILLSPWMLRNHTHTGVFKFTSIEASAIGWATARFLTATNGAPLTESYQELEERIGAPESEWRDIRLSSKVNEVSWGVILANPFSYAVYHTSSSLSFLFPSTISFAVDAYRTALNRAPPFTLGAIQFLATGDFSSFFKAISQVWWKVLERLVWLGMCVVALYALWRRRHDPLAWALVFVIGFFMLLAGPAAGPRYTLQALPFLFVLFATGCVYLAEYVRAYLRASK